MAVRTRQKHKEYALRALGAPTNKINVSDDQVEQCIDDSLQMFGEYHFDGIEPMPLKHQITEEDVTNKYITVPEDVVSIERIIPSRSSNISSSEDDYSFLWDIEYQLRLRDIVDLNYAGSLQTYVQTKQYLETLELVLPQFEEHFRYTRYPNRVYIDSLDWSDKSVGRYIVMEANRMVTPPADGKYWDNMWLKRYTTAKIGVQWGVNLSKYEGIRMVGDVTFNGQAILDRYTEQVEVLEDQLREEFMEPPLIFIG